MERIVVTIVPIFMLIGLGAGVRAIGMMSEAFTRPANRLVFYMAIPALVFRALSQAPLRGSFDPLAVLLMAAAVLLGAALARFLVRGRRRRDPPQAATFAQVAIHGNLGYIGLAVSYYYLDAEGFARTGMVIGFLMILQNLLGVFFLQEAGLRRNAADVSAAAGERWRCGRELFWRVLCNPVILAAVGGIVFSLSGWPLPEILDRFLKMLEGLALPLGLLLIGSNLSPGLLRRWLPEALTVSCVKLVLLPALALLLFRLAGVDQRNLLPVIILLAAPTATLTYVMAREMGGQVELATAAVSLTTVLSAVSYTLWLAALS